MSTPLPSPAGEARATPPSHQPSPHGVSAPSSGDAARGGKWPSRGKRPAADACRRSARPLVRSSRSTKLATIPATRFVIERRTVNSMCSRTYSGCACIALATARSTSFQILAWRADFARCGLVRFRSLDRRLSASETSGEGAVGCVPPAPSDLGASPSAEDDVPERRAALSRARIAVAFLMRDLSRIGRVGKLDLRFRQLVGVGRALPVLRRIVVPRSVRVEQVGACR